MNVCSVEGCNRKVHARGWCELHWGRWYRTGDPLHVNSPGPESTLDQWDGVLGKGMSYRQLDYWTRCGYLHANDPGPGSGHRRFWKPEEQAIAARMVRLVNAGVSLKIAARIARDGGETHEIGDGVVLTLRPGAGERTDDVNSHERMGATTETAPVGAGTPCDRGLDPVWRAVP